MKNPLTQAGIEPATFRFVAQHLNHCATAVLVEIVSFLNSKTRDLLPKLNFLNSKTWDLLPKPNNRLSVKKFYTLRDTGRSLGYSKQSATNNHIAVSNIFTSIFLDMCNIILLYTPGFLKWYRLFKFSNEIG